MRTNFLIKTLLGLSVVIAGAAGAKDLGIHGKVFPVVEQDIRVLAIQSAGRVNWERKQEQLKAQAKKFLDTLPSTTTQWTNQSKVRWIDPSIVTVEDVRGPWLNPATDQYEERVLVAKGTRFNPLDTYRPPDSMLFFNPSDPEQVSLVKKVVQQRSLTIMPVATGGNPQKITEDFGRPVFYAPESMLAQFDINETPSLLFVGEGEREKFLGLASFAHGVTPGKVLETLDTYTVKAKKTKSKAQQ